MLDEFKDPKSISEILKQKGNYEIKKSNRFKELMKFNEYWSHLFNIFYEKPFLRLIFHYFVSEAFKRYNSEPNVASLDFKTHQIFDINTIVEDFKNNNKNIENCILNFPLSIQICSLCGSDNIFKKNCYGKSYYHCRSCKQEFDNPELKNSLLELGPFDMYYFLDELVKAKILAKGYQFTCYNCGKFEFYPSEKNVERNILCPKCNSLRELIQNFALVEPTKDIKNLDSIWLEWYIYRIICEKCENIESILPVYHIIGENFKTEVDLIVLTKKKNIISIDCKAKTFKSSLSKNDIDNNILSWNKFSDLILIVTTTGISINCKKFWGNQIENIDFIEGKNLEKLNEIIHEL